MRVILCEDVDNLGDMGQQVNVAPGYARNFLLPRRLAVIADSSNAKQIEHEMRIIRKREEKRRVELQAVSADMKGLKLPFEAKAGEGGKLFGSITTLHIAQKLSELGREIGRRKIQLSEPIKTLGDHEVKVMLGSGVETTIVVSVTAEEPEAPAVEETEATSLESGVAAEESQADADLAAAETAASEGGEVAGPSEEEMPTPQIRGAE